MLPKKTKRIWIVNQYAVVPDQFGSTRHYDLAVELSKHYDVTIISSSFNNFERRSHAIDQLFKEEEINKRFRFIWIKTLPYKKNGLPRLFSAARYCSNLNRTASQLPKPDLIIGSSPQLLTAYQAYKIAKDFRVPFLFEIRDIWPQALVELGMSKLNPLVFWFRRIEKILNLDADHIIALMPYYHEYAKKNFGIGRNRVTWVSNGVANRYIKPYQKQKRNKQFIVTYAGTIGRSQNLQNIIYCAIMLRQYPIQLQIIGEGVGKSWLEQQIALNKLDKKIKLLPPVKKDKIHEFLKKSNALLFTLKASAIYQYGNPPNKLFDYMAAGRPVIFSSNARNNLIEQAKSGITCNPSDDHAIWKAILKLSRSKINDLDKMGLNGLKYITDHYCVTKLSYQLLSVIEHYLE